MDFQPLYRKHRPQPFAELVGQEAVSTALRNAVRDGRVGHAYLFSSPRGTGNTTTARLLAKALNCTGDRSALPPGEPCNSCPSCVEITAGTSMDVVELDAASNRGVGEMRALLERVAYRSAGGARKIYIVDEVHMLTKEASTALLKTLEEPPDHVIFVLATTDPQMVLPTIRSRTQHFEFSLLPADRLAAHLAELAAQGEALGAAAVVRALETLGEAAIEIRRAPDPRLVLEVTLVRLARRDVSSLVALADRVARLERALDDLRGALASGSAPAAP